MSDMMSDTVREDNVSVLSEMKSISSDEAQVFTVISGMGSDKKHQKLTLAELKKAMKKQDIKNWYEVIYGECVPYLDLERTYQDEDDYEFHMSVNTDEDMFGTVEKWAKTQNPNAKVYACSSHGATYDNDKLKGYKVSYHFVIRGIGYFDDGKQVEKLFDSEFTEKEIWGERSIELDPSVYKDKNKRQLMRMPYARKDKDCVERIIQPFKIVDGKAVAIKMRDMTDLEYENYMITNTKNEIHRTIEDKPKPKPKRVVERAYDDDSISMADTDLLSIKTKQNTITSFETFEQILRGIESKFNDYQNWRNILWASKAYVDDYQRETDEDIEEDVIEILDDISSRCHGYRGTDDVEDMFRRGNGSIKVASLWQLLKTTDLELFNQLQREEHKQKDQKLQAAAAKHKAFDQYDEFCWGDFENKYKSKKYNSLTELLDEIKVDIPRVVARVRSGTQSYIKKDSKLNLKVIIQKDKIKNCDFPIKYKAKGLKGEAIVKTFKLFEYDNEESIIPAYDDMDIYMDKCPPTSFNLWNGFAAQLVDEIDMELISEFLETFMKPVFCNGKQDVFDFSLKYFAALVKVFDAPIGTGLVIFSEAQGAGKNFMFDTFGSFVLGDANFMTVSSMDVLLDKNNSNQVGKRLIVCDEIESDGYSRKRMFTLLKTLMTSLKRYYSDKYMKSFPANNVNTLCFTSQHPDAFYVENSDRRFSIWQPANAKVGDKEYWTSLVAKFQNQNFGNHFYTYLMRHVEVKHADVRQAMMTEEKRDAIAVSEHGYVGFLRHVKQQWTVCCEKLKYNNMTSEEQQQYKAKEIKENGEQSWLDFENYDTYRFTSELAFNKHGEVQATAFYTMYVKWCKDNGSAFMTSRKFALDVKGRIDKREGKTCNYYNLNTINI